MRTAVTLAEIFLNNKYNREKIWQNSDTRYLYFKNYQFWSIVSLRQPIAFDTSFYHCSGVIYVFNFDFYERNNSVDYRKVQMTDNNSFHWVYLCTGLHHETEIFSDIEQLCVFREIFNRNFVKSLKEICIWIMNNLYTYSWLHDKDLAIEIILLRFKNNLDGYYQ